MAQVTEILGQLPAEAPDPLLELWKKLMAEGQGGQVAQQQGANISPAQATPQQAPTLNALLEQGMGKGLGPTQYGGGNETGLTYSGGVAGYAGAPRASDSTPVRTASYRDQAGMDDMVDQERIRNQPGPGGMSMGDLMDKIAPALKLGPAQYSAINAMNIPGVKVTDPAQVRADNAQLRGIGSGWQNMVFQDLLRKHKGNVDLATKEMQGVISGTSEARAQGTAAGSPMSPTAAKELNAMDSAKRQIEIVKENFNENFLGPVRGRDLTYDIRRQIGSYIGSPVGQKEEAFRGALRNAREQLIRAKEGAVIPPEMYERLSKLMPIETDEPKVFLNNLNRFITELEKASATTQARGVTPRGRAGGSNPVADYSKMSNEELLKALEGN